MKITLLIILLACSLLSANAALSPGTAGDTWFSNRWSVVNSNMTRWMQDDGVGRYRYIGPTNRGSQSIFKYNWWAIGAIGEKGVGFRFTLVLSNTVNGNVWIRSKVKGPHWQDEPWKEGTVSNIFGAYAP